MTQDQVRWAMQYDWYRDNEEIGFKITPIYRVRISDDGLLLWFSDYDKLMSWFESYKLRGYYK
jgi:hypothetical protein